ncbi:hypothetical protein DQ04_00201160 [Trypanosoma grayi]|uniref:hypothetical protein n=1 Tax=Trypanosoma grayi TaxID=71804 RepID=UPI0004F492BD|nr:hypothetical protein DQ04_00201160 [Trypanosoma grayi]KEG15063.1 hypothetical protein DQ04_00201160 [Trypanosoma grayi]
MGSALFRWEASEADTVVDALTFLDDDPHAPRFRFKHAATSTVQDAFLSSFRFYSRYVFLNVFTALQMVLALFTMYLFNYMGTVRYHYGPPIVPSLAVDGDAVLPSGSFSVSISTVSSLSSSTSQEQLPPAYPLNTRRALGPLYLAVATLGIFFVAFFAMYIVWLNSDWHMTLEMGRWVRDKRQHEQRGISASFGLHEMASSRRQKEQQQPSYSKESGGCRLRRLGVRWISGKWPYYAFPARYLTDFDYRHDLHVKYGAHATRRDPQSMLFVFAAPFVLILTIIDILTVDEMRLAGVSPALLHGLLLACGPLFLVYVTRSVLTRWMMWGRTCFTEMKTVLHA